jgi:tRNA threonylcarbamoyl adenosine modification protein YeaZ
MRTLAIDSATEACSVALFDDGRLIAGRFEMLGRGHAERLVPMIAELPDRGRAGKIAVSLGPGSFTGVRVGLAAARALALAWQADLLGYGTLTLVAAMAREKRGRQPVAVAMTGGHGEWFVQGFDASGMPTRELASRTAADAGLAMNEPLAAGSQAEALVHARGFGEALPLWPDARALALLPPEAFTGQVKPLYGRAPDAKLPGATT